MDDFDKQVAELLQLAMQQPGVAEIVQMYEVQQPALDAHAQAQNAVAPRWVVFVYLYVLLEPLHALLGHCSKGDYRP